ncbi:hypothetical protein RHGRI_014650 [Rhododendron griersonianum]|uniref:Uncharacterized protein n=1 Tax=Rhododendron griersonianum TaxID=479676 RepID=A0AAV6KAD8_9ERIC|nr:hypothetical protein RHGRI_014650 [Rhododendron griersonianum]
MAVTNKQLAVIVGALGIISFIFGVAAERNKVLPHSQRFAVTAGFAAALLLYTTVSEHILLTHNVHHDLDTQCPTAKTGLLGGAAFASLDSALFWLVALMLGTNVREDYFGETESGDDYGDANSVVMIG